MSDRTLSDADVEAIADALEKRVINSFYRDLGKGVWGICKRVMVYALLSIAAYGAVRGHLH